MPKWTHDNIDFDYRQEGEGFPFVFQHGLGGDSNQTFALYPPRPRLQLITLDSRAHGRTRPVGPNENITIADFADDVIALLDYLGISRAIIGGISLGAAVALNLALRYPDRTKGLVLCRPAWSPEPNPLLVDLYGRIAALIRSKGARRGRELFAAGEEFSAIETESTDCATSLLGQFDDPQIAQRVVRLERLPGDRPCDESMPMASIQVPTLILANRQDPIHPYAFGQRMAELLRHATFHEVTAKSISREAYNQDVGRCLDDYLHTHFLKAI